jgi:ATP-binding cassette subfamily B protein
LAKTTPNLLGLLSGYKALAGSLIAAAIVSSGLSLLIPALLAEAIDCLSKGSVVGMPSLTTLFGILIALIIANGIQIFLQTYLSEVIAKDMRHRVISKLGDLNSLTAETKTPGALLTNLTSDVDAVKSFVAQVVSSLSSSIFIVIASTLILFYINWKIALAVLPPMGLIACTFHILLGRVRDLFTKNYFLLGRLNTVINENIIGAALIRLVNASAFEVGKFNQINREILSVNLAILRHFAFMVPVITFLASAATFTLLGFGGATVISGGMTLGAFTAFNAYLATMIYPLIAIGLMSTTIANAQASLSRLAPLMTANIMRHAHIHVSNFHGNIEVRDASLSFQGRNILNQMSLTIPLGSRVAILGPTGAGKSILIQLLSGVLPSDKAVFYDQIPIESVTATCKGQQIGTVFQDNSIFNSTIKENICLGRSICTTDLNRAIMVAELREFISSLPNGVETRISERGTTLSGGQKQRIMLARALAGRPNILFLDDFTARVDAATEQKIYLNLTREYPNITMVVVSQKIRPIEDFDNIVLIMDGEILAVGPHQKLLKTSPEYIQIFQSQQFSDIDSLTPPSPPTQTGALGR